MFDNNVLFAFGLTLLAGLSTGIGSILALLSKKVNPKYLSAALGFSAGVMLYVSFVEILADARKSLVVLYGNKPGFWIATAAFFAGIGLIALIDKLVPEYENPHELKNISDKTDGTAPACDPRLMRVGVFTALAIGIHNFPEGIATFISALHTPALGISIAVAVAIHNIPEGLVVSVPIYCATGSRRKAFIYSFLSGLSEPVGAIIGYLLLRTFLNPAMFGIIFALVAGIMVYISLDELFPTAEKYGEHHIVITGFIAGMAVMAVSLLLLM
ncbi:MAG: zinc transporter ZupT [Elusimicrobiota bacterium]